MYRDLANTSRVSLCFRTRDKSDDDDDDYLETKERFWIQILLISFIH